MRVRVYPRTLMPGYWICSRCTSHAVGVQLGLGEQPFSLTLYFLVVICPKWIVHIKTIRVSYENGYTPRPNCTPTACVVWSCCIRKPGMRVRGRQAPSHSHTWLPYITPNGVRLAREMPFIWHKMAWKKSWILNTLPNGVIHYNDT